MIKYISIAILSGIMSSFSQILLKKSTEIRHDSKIKEYLNSYIIIGYGLTFLCMVLMVLAYKGLSYKYGAALESLAYLYVMILSRILLNEKITVKKLLGNIIIVIGVAVFNI